MRRLHAAAAMPLVLVLALTIGGAAYAAWTSSLSLSGSVQTGEVQAVWDHVSTQQYLDGTSVPIPPNSGIACVAKVEEGEPAQQASFLITGAFPFYVCEVTLGAQVTGTIPVGVDGIRTSALNPAGASVLGRDLVVQARLVQRNGPAGEKGGGCQKDVPLPLTTTFAPGDRFCVVVGIQVTRAVRVGQSFNVATVLDLVQWNLVPR